MWIGSRKGVNGSRHETGQVKGALNHRPKAARCVSLVTGLACRLDALRQQALEWIVCDHYLPPPLPGLRYDMIRLDKLYLLHLHSWASIGMDIVWYLASLNSYLSTGVPPGFGHLCPAVFLVTRGDLSANGCSRPERLAGDVEIELQLQTWAT